MDGSDRAITDLVIGLLESWMARRPEPAHVSRHFWMPDDSCSVCYDCDTQFTVFNRKHHCRLCGRIFCAKCTSNRLPAEPGEEDDTIRACNYCYKQWEKGQRENEVDHPDAAGTFTSATSFVSTRSSGSSSNIFVSLPQSSILSHLGSQDEGGAKGDDAAEQSLSQMQFDYFQNRRDDYDDDDDEDEFGSYYDPFHFEFDPNGDGVGSKSLSSLGLQHGLDSRDLEESQQVSREDIENDIGDECGTPSSLYAAEDINIEPVDFENNGVLWFPPEAEGEEDEREEFVFEDGGDEDASGELTNSISSGSGELRSRDKSNKENKRAMKNVVEGHFRALVAQLLQVDDLLPDEENDEESWLEIITALSWEAATLLKPDMSKGGQMDPGSYVKVKCLASGLRSQSEVVRGVVCKKNVAHRRMKSRIEKPRLLILGGALEYQRVSNALSSFDTLLQQEMDHLKMAVAKISVHEPNILLVEKSVSRYAQDYLLAKDISLVLNIKKPLLERIARCTGAQIVPTVDHLSPEKVGFCDMFDVTRFTEEHGTADQPEKKAVKTLMYFEGCPKPQGFTILLRGASGDELKKVKHVIQYGVFAAYHLALETSFLADEGASLPDNQSAIDMCISTLPGFSGDRTPVFQSLGDSQKAHVVPSSDLIKEAIASIHEYQCSDKHRVLASLNSKYVHHLNPSPPHHAVGSRDFVETGQSIEAKPKPIEVEAANLNLISSDGFRTPEEQAALKDEIPPSDDKSILVSLSSRCVWKGIVCERSHLFRFKYYGSFDKPLGRFLRDHLFDQSFVCRSCEMPAEAHVQCYTHRRGSLTISVKKLPEAILPGEEDGKIWMWHRCLRCPRANGYPPATRRVLMSDAAWGLSFGKFLELSFSNHAAASRVASCGHSLRRDCLRFYGFGETVACFRYASIDVHSVYLPPAKLEINYENQEWIEKEMNEVVGRAELLFSEVLNALGLLSERKCGPSTTNNGMEVLEASHLITRFEVLLHKEKTLFEERLRMVLKKEAEKGQPLVDILELNALRRELLFQSYLWDRRLIYAASLDSNIHPSKVEVTSIETVEKPLGETEKVLDINVPLPMSSPKEDTDHGKTSILSNLLEVVPQRTDLSPSSDNGDQNPFDSDALASGVNVDEKSPKSLYDTLDAAWTGESGPTIGFPKKCIVSGSAEEETKLDMEDDRKDSPSLSPVRSSGDEEDDTEIWLKTPFSIYYRSLDKACSGPDLTLDVLRGYSPVYISSFQDPELQGAARLFLPTGVNDTVIPVYDDEPTSLISYALVSHDYFSQLSDEPERPKDSPDSVLPMQPLESRPYPIFSSLDEVMLESYGTLGPGDESMLSSFKNSLNSDPVSCTKSVHVRVCFTDDGPLGKVRYDVTCYYARSFESLRRISYPSEEDFVRSLSRCKKWGAQGGKSNVFFAKTLDDRFIIKQVTKTELESFIKFAPSYFNYLSESISTRSPTCLAKILGIYQVSSKHVKGGKETKMDVLVMENLLFGRNITRLYDLKGSTRSRYNPDSSGSNKVLLDQNLIETMPTSPIFVGNKAKRVLERAVWNDTSFLASIDVMDYSLLVGVDEENHELVLGTIDFMRQYTWDKHLETWVKASGILGGSKNAPPTVISPKQYKIRFRKAMTAYFVMVPDQWSPPTNVCSQPQMEMVEENSVEEDT